MTDVPLPPIVPMLLMVLSPGPLRMMAGPLVPVIVLLLVIVSGPVSLMPVAPWMMAPPLLVIWPPPPSVIAVPPLTLSCAPPCMMTVTLVAPACAVIGVVAGLGGLTLQVTVWPVVGVVVGVQAARAGCVAKTMPPANANVSAAARSRPRIAWIESSRDAWRSGGIGSP